MFSSHREKKKQRNYFLSFKVQPSLIIKYLHKAVDYNLIDTVQIKSLTFALLLELKQVTLLSA